MGDLMANEHGTTDLREDQPDGLRTPPPVEGGPIDASGCSGAGAWQAFLRAHALVTRRVEADLLSVHRLSLVSFEVLELLAAAPGRRLRMAELAERLVVSRSGVTRAVDRLTREDLVVREACDSDLRGTYARLTERGLSRLMAAVPTHQAGVQFYLVEPLGAGGDAALAGLLQPVLERLASP